MRNSHRKKLRDLRRIARSAQNPHIYDLFDVYHPEYKKYDRSRRSEDWHTYHNAQRNWVDCIAGGDGGQGGIPAFFRRDQNRKLRTRQKAALDKAMARDSWDDFLLPKGRNNIRWLYW